MSWSRFKKYFYHNADLAVSLDISRIPFPDGFFGQMEGSMLKAFGDMAALEKGAIANPDENRMVGHYWLRAPQLAPTKELATEISSTPAAIKEFAAKVHSGAIAGSKRKFTHLLGGGIGGSAVRPQFRS